MDLPGKWWMKVQGVIFYDKPAEASCRMNMVWKQATVRIPPSFSTLTLMLSHEFIAEDLLAEERAKTILENYKLNGSAWYLASVAKKYMMLSTLTKFVNPK